MNFVLEKGRSWTALGLSIALWSTGIAVALGLADGLFKGPLSARYAIGDMHNAATLAMLSTWAYDLRQTFDGLIYIGALLFLGGKFFENRTIFTVGFDKLDGARIQLKGPDDDNVVWIGHRYASSLEARTVHAAIEDRLKNDSALNSATTSFTKDKGTESSQQ